MEMFGTIFNDFIFGGDAPLSYTQLCRMLNRIRKDIGFEETVVPQRFRTTVLTDIYDTHEGHQENPGSGRSYDCNHDAEALCQGQKTQILARRSLYLCVMVCQMPEACDGSCDCTLWA